MLELKLDRTPPLAELYATLPTTRLVILEQLIYKNNLLTVEARAVKAWLGVSKAIDAVTTAAGRVMFWLTLVMVLIGAFNVVTRYLGRSLGMSLGGTLYITLQTQLFNLIFLLGAAYVLNKASGQQRSPANFC